MTLSKSGPSGGEAEEAATPYKGSRCCVGFFQCQLCGHEWSSVYSWANSAQLCKPCSSKRRQTWVLPFRQIPKSRKYEFFCVTCDQYIAESYRARDAHQGIQCKACPNVVFPDWEFPCDDCNIVHLYSLSKSTAMRGMDCECGAFLFPKHMKSLNKKHESRFCQKCQELGVNCCNFKVKQAPSPTQERRGGEGVAKPVAAKKKPSPRRSGGRGKPKVSVSSVEAETPEKKVAPRKSPAKPRKKVISTSSVEPEVTERKAAPKRGPAKPRKKMVSTSSAEGEIIEKKTAPKRSAKPRKKMASTSSVEAEVAETKKSAQRRPPPQRRSKASVSSVDAETTEVKKSPRRRGPPKGRKKSAEHGAEEVVEMKATQTANRVPKSAPRGGGRMPKVRGHVYAEDNVLLHAPTPKNSVAVDPGIRERTTSKRAVKARQPRRPRVSGHADSKSDRDDIVEAEVDALADKVAEAVIISAKRVVEEKDEEAPRQQKDENDNVVVVKEVTKDEVTAVAPVKSGGVSPKAKASVELKGGHPPAIKVGGRRRVSSHRKSESEGKKGEAEMAVAEAEAEAEVADKAPENEAEADPEKSQVQVTTKAKMNVHHSEMSSVPQKPSPTKEVNRMAKVHPHHPTNKHPIQQPKKC